ncbi:MAG: LPS assembly protein LptD, partial [Planctomycetes bacterium]|nr:LPS assembly protein LptD [Planctomycetota bacterium]
MSVGARAEAPETAPELPAAPAAATPAEGAAPAAGPIIQVTGRILHKWYEKPGLRVVLVIDGFTVLTATEQLTARDGCVWFDEDEARRTGKARLGVYAETGVEYKDATGKVEKFDSVYLVMESAGEAEFHSDSDEATRGKADSTELFLRAKKLRKEYLESGRHEPPTGVVPPPEPPVKVEPPGVREAGVPQEITIVAQDDVRQVNFTSFVEDGVRVSIWTGGVYVMRGDMEMAADNLVIWTPEDAVRQTGRPKADEAATPASAGPAVESLPVPAGAAVEPAAGTADAAPARRLAAEAYFEGHVRINQGRRMLQCSQLYYDFQRNQALAIDTKIKSFAKGRNVPVYYYAKEVRQLAQGVFVGTKAWMTTCEFAHPHYAMGASKMTLTDLTPLPGEDPEKPEYRRVRFVGDDVQARVRDMPLTYWPRMAGDVSEAETALRKIAIESRSNRGTGLVTQWHLMKLLGLEKEPEGFDIYLNADVWSERGPGLGVESEYTRKDFYGNLISYYLNDSGKDSVGEDDVEPGSSNRGRILWRHRQYLPQNWEMTLELAKISDRNFLNEFYEREDETGKTQETLIYLKKQEQEQALTILASARLNDYQTQTEYYPQIGYNMIGRSLWDDHLTYFQDSELSVARYRPDDDLGVPGSSTTLIGDTIHELDLPLKLGTVNVVPFTEGRLSYFEETLNDSGSEGRYAARMGARAATQAWRVYDDVESDFWDVHRVRHVNIFDVSASAATNNVASRDLIPFDVTEAGTPLVQGTDDMGIVELGWRQRFQTKRGPPAKRQIVDWLTLDLEATFFNNLTPPNIAPDGRRAFDHLDFMTDWRVTDSVSMWTDTNFNIEDGTLDQFTFGTA